MKRIAALSLSLILLLSGCGTVNNAPEEITIAPETETTQPAIAEATVEATFPVEAATEETTRPSTEAAFLTEETTASSISVEIPTEESTVTSTDNQKPAGGETMHSTSAQKPVVETTVSSTPAGNTTAKPVTGSTTTTKPTTNTQTTPQSYPEATENGVLYFMESTQNMGIGQTVKADYVYNGSGKLSWHVDHLRGFKVDQSGNMTPLAEGNYEVYVTDGKYTSKLEVFVPGAWYGHPHGFYFTENRIEMTAGTTRLMPEITGSSLGTSLLSTSDPSVVEISGSGYLTAVAPGTAIITARQSFSYCKLIVTVKPAAQTVRLELDKTSASLYVLDTIQLKANYTGSGYLTWSSSHSCVAYVDENGLVTARDEGTCEIYVSDGTFAAKCTVTVSIDPAAKVNKLELNNINGIFYDGAIRYKGDAIQFRVRAYPDNASDRTYITVSDSSVIRVSKELMCCRPTFHLEFRKAGTCVVQIHSGDNQVVESYTIHVKDEYPCKPHSGQLTVEEFLAAYNGVLAANGMNTDCMPSGYLVLTINAEDMTWENAKKWGQGLSHHWWSIGYRRMLVTFEGINEKGQYVFYERGA